MPVFSEHAIDAARSICNYCCGRFPGGPRPNDLLDLPWMAEKIQLAIDAALEESRASCRSGAGAKIKQRRMHLGMRQQHLAAAAGISKSCLCKIEAGASPGREGTRRKLAKALQMPDDWLRLEG